MKEEKFYTLRGYSKLVKTSITFAMEDYLEMIYRIECKGETVKVGNLAKLLNVTPASSSKMINRLKEQGLIDSEPYGLISLTDKGNDLGKYLLHRHETLNSFFCRLNNSDNELELVEKIEHYFDRRTIDNIFTYLNQI